MIDNVVVALVHAQAVRRRVECFSDVLDVRDAVYERVHWPSIVTLLHRIKVDCTKRGGQVNRSCKS